MIKVDHERSVDGRNAGLILNIYLKNGVYLEKVDVDDQNTIRKALLKEQEYLADIKKMAQHPKENIYLNDFWVESITGFAFSHIKPNSQLGIALRFIQIITAFLFLNFISNTLKASGRFILELSSRKSQEK